MLGKTSIVAYIIAAVLHYTNGQMNLFWLSVVLGIVTAGLGEYSAKSEPLNPLYRATRYDGESHWHS